MLFDGDGIVGSALDATAVSTGDTEVAFRDLRAVIGHNHAHGAFDCTNACHNTSCRYFLSRIHLMSGQS